MNAKRASTKTSASGSQRDLFLDMIATERNASRNTLDAYRRDLDDYAEFLAGKKTDFSNADTQTIRAYLGSLAKREMAAASVARKLSAIRQLHRFLYTEGLRSGDPAAVLEGPRRGRPLPKVMTVGEVTKLLTAAHEATQTGDDKKESTRRLRALRLVCLLETLYATGLRISELIALPASAARTKADAIVVRGKGNKERLVPIGDAAKRAM
jgi:integrase/recombinase XerD